MQRSGGAITLKTAADIATNMATGIFAPIYGQVDPLHIGEAGRAMSIAGHYGKRLLSRGRNLDPAALDIIMSAYPSHSFVIDYQEAEYLFQNVQRPSEKQTLLAESLGDQARWPSHWRLGDPAPFVFLSTELKESEIVDEEENEKEVNDGAELGGTAGPGLGFSAETSREKPAGSNGNRESVPIHEVAP